MISSIHLNKVKNISSILTNIPYKLINNKLFEISELCEGHIINFHKNNIIKPETILTNKSSICHTNYKNIPISLATKHNLEYFNCKLINNMNIFIMENNIDNKNTHIKKLNFIEKEFNNNDNNFNCKINDFPSFLKPYDRYSKGFIILGKFNEFTKIELGAFTIPSNCGIYIPKNIPYNDRFIDGKWKYTE